MKNNTGIGACGGKTNILTAITIGLTLILTGTGELSADGGVTFSDIAANNGNGISYRRTPSRSNAIWEALKQKGIYLPSDVPLTPTKPRGDPGVAIFDYDGDGDLDIYVTNGPGTPNSLYTNQYKQTGKVSFIDVAAAANVQAKDQDSTGVCFGDIDNDGDYDLYVLGNGEPNRLFQNQGDGTFIDITSLSGTGGGNNASTTCSFGDVNGDGLLDLVVANLFDNLNDRIPIMSLDVDQRVQHDQLFINRGNNVFVDKSAESGIQNIRGISWAIALVDYDLDGDVDLVIANDQGSRKPAKDGGRDAGRLRLFQNDGKGVFTDVTERVAGGRFGAWMSLAFGDLNADGLMDMFGSNVGDYFAQFAAPFLDFVPKRGDWEAGWFLGDRNGTFSFPGVGALKAMPFGWGSVIVDYDNDGDQDIIYHGGWENGPFVDASNPGAVLANDGNANFTRDVRALAQSTDHSRRAVHGVAVGDLNADGFPDIVSVSNMNWPKTAPLVPYFSDAAQRFGGPFDATAFIWPTFSPINPADISRGFKWNGIEPENGTLAIEMNSANNGNKGVRIKLLGTKGIIENGRVNRDGIGAVASVEPHNGKRVMAPVVSGGTHASSNSLELSFGLGKASSGVVEILWPGGVRNRLYDVRASEQVLLPEIPCSFEDDSFTRTEYHHCVVQALGQLETMRVIDNAQSNRIFKSAMKAYAESEKQLSRNRIKFEDLSRRIEFSHTTNGDEGHGGVAWLDYNNDGFLDIFFTNAFGNKNGLFRNNGDGTFTDVSARAGIENGLGNSGVLAGDIDNDGYVDLFLTSSGGLFTPVTPSPVKLYHNNGNGTFTDVTAHSGITGIKTSWSAAFGDINGDGFVDLFISAPGSVLEQRQDQVMLFLNNGNMTFTNITESAGVTSAMGGCVVGFTDYDLDGDQDIILGNCNDIALGVVPIQLFRNNGNLTFTDVTIQAGLTRLGAWMGLAIGDYNNDGNQDIFLTSLGTFPNLPRSVTLPVLYRNNGNGTFTDVSLQAGVSDEIWGWGATLTDFNNDGFLDIFYAGSFPFAPFSVTGSLASPGTLYINNKDGTFVNHNPWLGVDLSNQYITGVAAGDIDNDGFLDLAIVSGSTTLDGQLTGPRIPGHPVLLRNQGNANNRIIIKTVGTRSNRGGIGARVVVKADELTQTKEVRAGSSFLSTESPWLTFGLGKHSVVDKIVIRWPSGRLEHFGKVAANQIVTLIEGKGIVVQKGKEEEHE